MKNKKWFYGMLATAFAFSLVSADIASAQYGGCGQGQGGGRGVCVQSDKATNPNYQQGRGRRKGGQGRQQRLRDGSCINNPTTQAPATTAATAPSN